MQLLSRKERSKKATNVQCIYEQSIYMHTHILAKIDTIIYSVTSTHNHSKIHEEKILYTITTTWYIHTSEVVHLI